jgi:hypothetical protein
MNMKKIVVSQMKMRRSKKWIQEQAVDISKGIIEDHKCEYIQNHLHDETQETRDAVSLQCSILRIKPRILR